MKPIEVSVKVKGKEFEGELDILDYVIGDCGIGPYEYFGQAGDDIQPCVDDYEYELYVWSERKQDMLKVSKRFKDEVDEYIWDTYGEQIEELCFEGEEGKML